VVLVFREVGLRFFAEAEVGFGRASLRVDEAVVGLGVGAGVRGEGDFLMGRRVFLGRIFFPEDFGFFMEIYKPK